MSAKKPLVALEQAMSGWVDSMERRLASFAKPNTQFDRADLLASEFYRLLGRLDVSRPDLAERIAVAIGADIHKPAT